MSAKVSIIVPVLYVEPQLPETLRQLAAQREQVDLELLIIVDIPDPGREQEVTAATEPVAEQVGARAVYRVGERGFGAALRRGFAEATGDILIPVMADASDRPEDIPRLAHALEDGLDVVAGSRYMAGGGIIGNTNKQRMSRLYSVALRLLGGPKIHDVSNAFKAYHRSVIQALSTEAASFDISVELALKAHLAGFRVGEIPTVWTNRQLGSSNFDVPREVRNYGRWLWLAAGARFGRRRGEHAITRPTGRSSG
jgi:glycosyltransferase involved in cell wall biosynthesis